MAESLWTVQVFGIPLLITLRRLEFLQTFGRPIHPIEKRAADHQTRYHNCPYNFYGHAILFILPHITWLNTKLIVAQKDTQTLISTLTPHLHSLFVFKQKLVHPSSTFSIKWNLLNFSYHFKCMAQLKNHFHFHANTHTHTPRVCGIIFFFICLLCATRLVFRKS